MYISLNWLKDFVDLEITNEAANLKNVVVGHVKKLTQHPNADRLKVAEVEVGDKKILQIVCAGINLEEGIYVPVALPGAILPGNFEIKKCEIRGVESNGMICHISELGLGEPEAEKKITIIEKDEPGTPFPKTEKSSGMSAQDLADLLTLKTAEVEKIEKEGRGLEGVVIGEILEIKKHPDADKLNVAQVDIGKSKPIQLIFGQMVVMEIGNKVPVAVAPTTLPTGLEINKKELRGIITEGMLCLDQELGFKKEGVSIMYFPDEKPGTPLVKLLDLTDTIIEVDNKAITHRPDLWGHYGIAREVAAITGKKLRVLNPKVEFPTKGEAIDVKVEYTKLCPRFCAVVINNIKIEESPEWLQKRLRSIGHGVHNNIVDVTNYVMAEIGHPMHAFDKDYIEGGIVIRAAKEGEKFTTLDKKERTLSAEMGVVADHKKAVGIAGIMGGQNSEITEKTTSIILEAANWHPTLLRRASTQLGLRTDAVQRFEKSLDPLLAELAIKRAAEIILRICRGAEIAGPMTDIKNFSEKALEIEMDIEKTKSKIGIEIEKKEIINILEKLEFKIKEKSENILSVTVPSFRATKDVSSEDDLIEEIARMYGYDNIPDSLPTLPAKLPAENTERFIKHRARELFSYGLGFDEVYNYSFYGQTDLEKCLMNEKGHVKLLNYLSEDQTHLRTTLIPNLLKNLELNVKYFEEVKIYEIGRSYKEIGEYMPLEEKRIAGAILLKGKSDAPFYQAKGSVEAFLKHFSIPMPTKVKEVKNAPYAHPSKALSYIDVHAQTIAQVFMLHPEVTKNHDLEKYSIAIFELNFTELMKFKKEEKSYKKIPKFPNIEIDISVLVDRNMEVEKVQNAMSEADKDLITDVTLFDIYQGAGIEPDKKAVAFKITLQASDRTLTDEEMLAIQKKIFSNLEKIGGKVRGK